MKLTRSISVSILMTLAVAQFVCGQTWTKLSTTDGPTTDNGSSLVYDQMSNRLILFAGQIGTPCCTSNNDVWVLTDPNGLDASPVWNKLDAAIPNGAPPARSFQSAVYDSSNNIMIVFGGGLAGTCGYFCTIYNDVWVLTNANGIGGAPTWIPLSPTGAAPVAREGHTAIYDSTKNRMIVFGGGNNGIMDVPNDLWALDNANGLNGTPQWVQLSEGGQIPPPVERFATAYDSINNRMTIFGGCCYWNNTTWLLTGANGLAGTPTWTQISPSGTVPQIREVHAFGYDPALDELIIFGFGAADATYNDTWALSSANDIVGTPAWTNTIPNNQSGSPPFPFLTADPGIYDAVHSRLMLVKSQDNGQGGLQIVPWVLSLNTSIPFLKFPLMNKSETSARIASVFDHSMFVGQGQEQQYGYCPDEKVTAYTGETGMSPYGSSLVGTFTCGLPTAHSVDLYGWAQQSGLPFIINGHYAGSSREAQFLAYDGHPGFDYVTQDQGPNGTLCTKIIYCNASGQTPVLAAAAGTVVCINPGTTKTAPCLEGPGEIKIDHGNGYFTVYLHLSSEFVKVSEIVAQSQQIGVSGQVGANEGGAHLHFEVRKLLKSEDRTCGIPTDCVPVDPYGWKGTGKDPYTRALNVDLWQ